MPGWWFTIESTTTRHFIRQLKTAVENALRSKPDVRAIMRARATKQRFPVKQWVEDLEKLQSSAIELSHEQAAGEKRPIFESPNTPVILETPDLLSVLQSHSTNPPMRPRSGMMQAPNQGRALATISEARPRSPIAEAPNQNRVISTFSEVRLLAGSSPGLGSKMGPSSRRKAPPPLVLNNLSKRASKTDSAAVQRQSGGELADNNQRAPIPHSPSSPDLHARHNLSMRETTETLERPKTRRSQSMPQPPPNDRKAVGLLGTQLSASRASALISPEYPASSSDENSSQPPSTPGTPITSSTVNSTPPKTPTLLLSRLSMPSRATVSSNRMSRATFSFLSNPIAGTLDGGDESDGAATSTSAAHSSGTTNSANAAKPNLMYTPRAVDSLTNLDSQNFSHSGMPVLSTSAVKGGKPDNILQDVTPFFSDPGEEYETYFRQELQKLNGKNSENQLCIEEFLLKSEKSWFGKLRAAEMRRVSESSPLEGQSPEADAQGVRKKRATEDTFGLKNNHKPPTGLERILRMRIGDWPVYSFLLAFVRECAPCPCVG